MSQPSMGGLPKWQHQVDWSAGHWFLAGKVLKRPATDGASCPSQPADGLDGPEPPLAANQDSTELASRKVTPSPLEREEPVEHLLRVELPTVFTTSPVPHSSLLDQSLVRGPDEWPIMTQGAH